MLHIKEQLYEIVFEADTPKGKMFDILLLIMILFSILVVMLESVASINTNYRGLLRGAEWFVTIIFTMEYVLRLVIVRKPFRYVVSFYGVIDLLSILPTYLAIFIVGAQGLVVIRALRLLRVFRILKLSRYVSESRVILLALRNSRVKIGVFLYSVVMIVIIIGTVMYLVEGEEYGFTSIPKSIYWAIVTLTTVGYGDIAPQTPMGQVLASFVMIMGYAIIAVPTGIVTSEFALVGQRKQLTTQVCPACLKEGHDHDADFCKFCSSELNPEYEE